jgi:hypothetical protein
MNPQTNEQLLLDKLNLSGYNIYVGTLKWTYDNNKFICWFHIYYNKKCKNRDYNPENVVDTRSPVGSKPKKKLSFDEEIVDTTPIFCYVLVCADKVLDSFFYNTTIDIQTFVTPETEDLRVATRPVANDDNDDNDNDDNDDNDDDENLTRELNNAASNKYINTHNQIGGSHVGTLIYITDDDFVNIVNIPNKGTLTITGKDGNPVTLPGIFEFHPESTYDPHKDPDLVSKLKDKEILIVRIDRRYGDRRIVAYNTLTRKKRILKTILQTGGYNKHKKKQTRSNTRKKRKHNKKKRTIRKIIKK